MRKISLFLFISLAITVTLIFSSCSFSDSTDKVCTHKWSAATCTEPAKCTLCSQFYGEPRAHTYISTVIAATCTEQGYVQSECSNCGHVQKDNYTEKLSHTPSEWIFDKEATDTEPGEKHTECTVCGRILEIRQILPHTHTLETREYKAPTCTVAGNYEYEYCTVCGYNNYREIAPIGHDFGDWTSTGNGTHSRICTNDPTHIENEPCVGGDGNADELPICDFCGAAYDFGAREGNSTYGYYALGKYPNGKDMQRLYKEMKNSAEKFLLNNENISSSNGYYIIGEYKCPDYGLTLDEATAVWKIFYIENPVYYWLSNISVSSSDNRLYLTIDREYASADYRLQCDAAISLMREECATLINGSMSELERAMAISAYIVSNMEYAYENDGVTPEDAPWAHNILGLAKYSSGVCESYSKSFLYLSLLHNVDCIIVTGHAGEPHSWNYFKVDEVWYGADITWTDNSGNAVVYDMFGVSDSNIHSDHLLHSSVAFGIQFIYEIPNISENGMELCTLYKGSEHIGTYIDIDLAFAAMNGPDSEYEIRIGFYSSFVGAPTYSLDSIKLPEVKKITIVGKNHKVGDGYLDENSVLNINSDLDITTDLELNNLELRGNGSIDLISKKLTFTGSSAYVYLRIVGTADGSEILIDTYDGTYFFEGVDVYRLRILRDIAIFGKSSHIVYGVGDEFYTTTPDVTLDIENRE